MRLQGLKIYKADPLPGKRPSWLRVECTEMLLTQRELYGMVDKRADQISAASQYQTLSAPLRDVVNRLIHWKRNVDSGVEWTCAYVKKHGSSSETPCDCQGRGSLVVILMKRPKRHGDWPRTPMGDLIDWGSRGPSTEQGDLSEAPSSDLEMENSDGEDTSSQGF
jgi:hypothetical protein